MEGNTIRGVIVESKAGREAILAKRVIDATGDADIAHRAGAPTHMHPVDEMMSVSVMFSMCGVNKTRFIDAVKADPQTYGDWAVGGEWEVITSGKEDAMFSPFLRKPFQKALEAGLIPDSVKTMAGTWGTVSDQGDLTYLNMCHLYLDGTNPDALTHGEMAGRKQAMHAIAALQAFMPGCEDAKLRNFGMSIGIFPEFIDGYGYLILPTTGRYFHLPYRSMLPKNVKHLITAGRVIGGDKVSHAAVRNMMCCAVAGQGAGVAAALAVKSDRDFCDVDISAVQKELIRQGARIG
jgi:hypothetical protein